MSRMRRNGHVWYAEEAPSRDFGHLKTIEVLQIHFRRDALQCALYLLFTKDTEIHCLHFGGHEKEVPSRSMDHAIESECIRSLDHAPLPEAGFSFQPRKMRHSDALFHIQSESCHF